MVIASDSALIDYLESVHKASGFELCVMRESTTGRGWRLHSLAMHEAEALDVLSDCKRTVREAISRFMDANEIAYGYEWHGDDGDRAAWLKDSAAAVINHVGEPFDRLEEAYGNGI